LGAGGLIEMVDSSYILLVKPAPTGCGG